MFRGENMSIYAQRRFQRKNGNKFVDIYISEDTESLFLDGKSVLFSELPVLIGKTIKVRVRYKNLKYIGYKSGMVKKKPILK